MKIPIKADLLCVDGLFGSVKEVIINPADCTATHFVVKSKYNKHNFVLIPINTIGFSSDRVVAIDKEAALFNQYPLLYETRTNGTNLSDSEYDWEDYINNITYSYNISPSIAYDWSNLVVDRIKNLPKGDIELKTNMCVKDNKGKKLGHIQEIIIDKNNGVISDIIFKTSSFIGSKEVIVPYESVKTVDNKCITLY